MRRTRSGLALLAVLAGIAACGSPAGSPVGSQAVATHASASTASAKTAQPAATAPQPTATATAPQPAGTTPQPAGAAPSAISRMVCAPKAAAEIEQVMGAKAAVASPSWTGHLYSCGYRYNQGTMVLSIKELSSWSQTYAYFDLLAGTLHKTTLIKQLGQGAFITSNGSVVVRKDWKILLVDITGVHGDVGSPPKPPGELAIYVAQVILGCWAGDLSMR